MSQFPDDINANRRIWTFLKVILVVINLYVRIRFTVLRIFLITLAFLAYRSNWRERRSPFLLGFISFSTGLSAFVQFFSQVMKRKKANIGSASEMVTIMVDWKGRIVQEKNMFCYLHPGNVCGACVFPQWLEDTLNQNAEAKEFPSCVKEVTLVLKVKSSVHVAGF